MISFTLRTSQRQEIVDITAQVQEIIARQGMETGAALVYVAHCTCALYINENERGLVADTLNLIQSLTQQPGWQHNRIDDNAEAHLAATLLGSSVLLPVSQGRLQLGTWQRVMLVELDGPRQRSITVSFLAKVPEG